MCPFCTGLIGEMDSQACCFEFIGHDHAEICVQQKLGTVSMEGLLRPSKDVGGADPAAWLLPATRSPAEGETGDDNNK